jgi:hypothetical protein
MAKLNLKRLAEQTGLPETELREIEPLVENEQEAISLLQWMSNHPGIPAAEAINQMRNQRSGEYNPAQEELNANTEFMGAVQASVIRIAEEYRVGVAAGLRAVLPAVDCAVIREVFPEHTTNVVASLRNSLVAQKREQYCAPMFNDVKKMLLLDGVK